MFTLYNPYRVVIDFHKTGAPVSAAALTRLPVSSAVPAAPLKRAADGARRSRACGAW